MQIVWQKLWGLVTTHPWFPPNSEMQRVNCLADLWVTSLEGISITTSMIKRVHTWCEESFRPQQRKIHVLSKLAEGSVTNAIGDTEYFWQETVISPC